MNLRNHEPPILTHCQIPFHNFLLVRKMISEHGIDFEWFYSTVDVSKEKLVFVMIMYFYGLHDISKMQIFGPSCHFPFSFYFAGWSGALSSPSTWASQLWCLVEVLSGPLCHIQAVSYLAKTRFVCTVMKPYPCPVPLSPVVWAILQNIKFNPTPELSRSGAISSHNGKVLNYLLPF